MEEFSNHDDFLRAACRMETEIKKSPKTKDLRRAYRDVEDVERRVFKGDHILLDGGASICPIIVLFDRINKIGCLLHCASPNIIKGLIPKAVSEMQKLGTTKITAFIAGGAPFRAGGMQRNGKNDGAKNWDAVSEVLTKYKKLIWCVKEIKNFEVEFIALHTTNGNVIYAVENQSDGSYYIDKFTFP